jgi:surface antigen
MGTARTSFGLATVAALALTSVPAHAIDPTITQAAEQILTNRTGANVDNGQRSTGGGLLGSIFGCSAGGSSQTIGAVAGGAVGGLIGSKIKGTVGTILGGALGAAAGSALGCKLQQNDRMRAERAAQAAVASNQSQTWRNDETGASGSVEVASANSIALGDIRFANGVEPAAGFVKVGDSYTATSVANIRNAPGATGTVLGKLAAGQRVYVPASVKGQPWMLVAEGGVGQGYVSTSLLRRATTVASASNCKIVKQSVTVPGESEATESYHACKGADGQWTMTRV